MLGQSFGGFAAVTYLSFAPHGMREAVITGGLPGLDASAEDVYRLTYRICAARNTAHYERYPGDVDAARRVAEHLAGRDVTLPNGARLTVEAFQAIGGTGCHRPGSPLTRRPISAAAATTRVAMRSAAVSSTSEAGKVTATPASG